MTEQVNLDELESGDTVEIRADGGRGGPTAGARAGEVPDATVEIPDGATDDEIDAIATAVREYLRTHATDAGGSRDDRQWVYAGRIGCDGAAGRRALDGSAEPWVAAGRAVR